MKKYLIAVFLILITGFCSCSFAFSFKKEKKPILYVLPIDPKSKSNLDEAIESYTRFIVSTKIYFMIYNPKGFTSDYIKYQIVKQEDEAHIGGYTRIRNITKRVNDKNYFSDYFVLHEKGKYYLQVFDITNLHQWLAITYFEVVDE